MGKCRDRVKRFGRRAAKILGPILGAMIPGLVTAAEGLGAVVTAQLPDLVWGGHEKRKFVIDTVMREAKAIGHDAYSGAKALTLGQLEGATRAAIEAAVDNMRVGGAAAVAELADWSTHEADVQALEDPNDIDVDLA